MRDNTERPATEHDLRVSAALSRISNLRQGGLEWLDYHGAVLAGIKDQLTNGPHLFSDRDLAAIEVFIDHCEAAAPEMGPDLILSESELGDLSWEASSWPFPSYPEPLIGEFADLGLYLALDGGMRQLRGVTIVLVAATALHALAAPCH